MVNLIKLLVFMYGKVRMKPILMRPTEEERELYRKKVDESDGGQNYD